MRVERQGMTVDYTPARKEAASQPLQQPGAKKGGEDKRKIGLQDIKQYPNYSEQDLKIATETVNKALKISNYHLEFKLHEDSGRYQVKVVDSESGDVIREIPPEDVLEFSAQVRKMLDKLIGIFVDELA